MSYVSDVTSNLSSAAHYTTNAVGQAASYGWKAASGVASGVKNILGNATHFGLRVTAESADFLGKTTLIVGSASTAALGYDAWAWGQGISTPWSTLNPCYTEGTLARIIKIKVFGGPCTSVNLYPKQGEEVNGDIMLAIGVAVATPIIALACFKIRDLTRELTKQP